MPWDRALTPDIFFVTCEFWTAPNAPKRKEVASFAKRTLFEPPTIRLPKISEKIKRASLTWAELIKRIYEKDPLVCPYGHKMKIVRFVTKGAEIYSTLFRLGLPTTMPELEEATGYENYDNYLEASEKFIDYLEMDSEVYSGTDPPKEIKFSTDYEESDWPDPWSYNDLSEGTSDGFFEDIDIAPEAPDDLSKYVDEYAIEV